MEQHLSDYFFNCNEIALYVDGTPKIVDKQILEEPLRKLTDKSYFSPAFGVSIHKLTVESMKKGYWLEFRFNTEQSFAEMPFTKLLIQVLPDMYGFNVVRFYNNEYSGRCFYLNLNNTSTKFYNFLTTL